MSDDGMYRRCSVRCAAKDADLFREIGFKTTCLEEDGATAFLFRDGCDAPNDPGVLGIAASGVPFTGVVASHSECKAERFCTDDGGIMAAPSESDGELIVRIDDDGIVNSGDVSYTEWFLQVCRDADSLIEARTAEEG